MQFVRGMMLMLGAVAVATAAESPAPRLTVLEQEFMLIYVAAREAYTLNDYVPPGETAKAWTRHLTIVHAPNTSQPAIALKSLLRSTQKSEELAIKSQVMGRQGVKDGDDLTILLVFKDPENGNREYNLQRYVKLPGVAGVMSYQYARIYAATAPPPNPDELGAWVKALWAMDTPVHDKLPM